MYFFSFLILVRPVITQCTKGSIPEVEIYSQFGYGQIVDLSELGDTY